MFLTLRGISVISRGTNQISIKQSTSLSDNAYLLQYLDTKKLENRELFVLKWHVHNMSLHTPPKSKKLIEFLFILQQHNLKVEMKN